jgi:hypothetical protein
MSRMLETLMTLLFSVNKINRIKAAGRIRDFFVVICKFFGLYRSSFSALQGGKLCGYLLWSRLQRRFITVGYHLSPIISIGGGLNDFNE